MAWSYQYKVSPRIDIRTNSYGKFQFQFPLWHHPLPTTPWQKIASDIFQPATDFYLIIADYYSLWPEVYQLPTTISDIAKQCNHSSRNVINFTCVKLAFFVNRTRKKIIIYFSVNNKPFITFPNQKPSIKSFFEQHEKLRNINFTCGFTNIEIESNKAAIITWFLFLLDAILWRDIIK